MTMVPAPQDDIRGFRRHESPWFSLLVNSVQYRASTITPIPRVNQRYRSIHELPFRSDCYSLLRDKCLERPDTASSPPRAPFVRARVMNAGFNENGETQPLSCEDQSQIILLTSRHTIVACYSCRWELNIYEKNIVRFFFFFFL